VTDDPAFYARALRRVGRLTIAIAIVAIPGVWIWQGWRGGLGCAIGGLGSVINLGLWKRLANAIGPTGDAPATGSAMFLGMRYLLLGCAVFVIMKYLEVSLLAILAGLLSSVAAVLVEIVYELIFTSEEA
jgi:hypothetical protein